MGRTALGIVGVLGIAGVLVACGSADGAPSPGGIGAATPSPAGGSTSPATPAPAPAPGAPGAPAPLGAPYPIVLMHGMSGFGVLEVGPVDVTYFDGVAEDLAKRGEQVFVTVVPPYDTSEERAKALAPQIDQILKTTGKAKVNLVGHSQGGMDARVITSPAGLGYGDRVASVTTIATPNHGSKVADAVMGLIDDLPSSVVDEVTGDFLSLLEKSAFELQSDPHIRAQTNELTEAYMNGTFNPTYIDDPKVAYTSYAGRTNLLTGVGDCDGGAYANDPTSLDAAQPLLVGTATFLEGTSLTPNDGLVTVDSAKWGTFLQCVPADHLKEVGQLQPAAATFDHLAFFRDVVARIRSAGF